MPAIMNMNNITIPQRGQGVNIKLIIIMVSVFRKDTHFQTILLTQLLRFILVFLANQRFVFLICFTVFYKF